MGDNNDQIFPILDRRTPLLDRVRGGDDEDEVAKELGKVVGKAVKTDDEEKLDQAHEEFKTSFAESVADELGVDVSDVDAQYLSSVSDAVIGPKEQDVLSDSALETLGIPTDDGEGDEEQDFSF